MIFSYNFFSSNLGLDQQPWFLNKKTEDWAKCLRVKLLGKLGRVWHAASFVDGKSVQGEALVELLKALNDSNKMITDWNDHFVSPCFSWSHVTCRNGNVISLSLASKGFSGTLSPSIAKLQFLVSLELQNNHLSGVLPDYLGSMAQLQNLNLASNNFSGSIPTVWGQLPNLKHLDLSSNNFTGKIPSKLFSVPTFNFTETHLECGSSLHQPCISGSSVPASIRRSKFGVTLGAAVGAAFLLLTIASISAYLYCRVNRKPEAFFDVSGEDEHKIFFGQLRRFSWRELQVATDNFSETNIIGHGGFGKVYKGVLFDKTKIAVKRLTDYHNPGGEAAFQREVELISVAVHRNLLRLLGFCTTPSERILVYPFMQNLSVAYRLRDLKPGERGLDWPTRKRVAFGTAHGKSSEKTDVFGYGITLLELVTGQRAIDFSRLEEEEDVLLLDHIKKLLREKRLHDIVDNNLEHNYDPKEVEILVQVALLCTQSSPEDRPKMTEVVSMLQGDGLAERWSEWEQLEVIRNQEYSLMARQFIWDDDSIQDQEAIELSAAR
ncbi:Receptor-like kinase [Thalictrum thalictroides]|uniref:non-specific serine/threonine protein kinase n=1 Tax=Thalictrum thalictroides TaxID=46969 RepID=A0A7J6X8H2_THATH|nr:Receptor-like kinase [Thalictrum thalictroides]